MNYRYKNGKLALSAAALMIWSGAGSAQGFFSDIWKQTSFHNQVRFDLAFRTSGMQNPNNQTAAPFQDVAVPRQAFIPPDLAVGLINWGALPLLVLPGLSVPGLLEAADTVRRSDRLPNDDVDFNYHVIRYTGEMDMRFSRQWRLNVRARALYDPTFEASFNARDVMNDQGGIAGGGADRYADTGRTNFYEARGREGHNINPLEIAGRDFMIDLPTFIINYQGGSYDIRFGNQQIAWGQAIFFRTLDLVNGLDLRRHLIIDRAIEEFEDKRVSKLALRATTQVTDSVVLDGFVGKFQPDVLPNPNTPYNVIPAQFYRPIDNYFTGDYDSKIDYGFRLKADYGGFGWQAVAISRYNPLGTFSWARSGINKGLTPWGGVIGGVVETAYALKPPCVGAQNPYDNFCRLYANVGEALAESPFTVGPGGIYSDQEWFSTAASVRLNGLDALNTAIAEFPGLRDVFASPVDNVDQASALLNTFFIGSGGSIRGNVERDYHRENIIGLGASYVTETGDINSFWDQFILNLEVQYTPERAFTRPNLSGDPLRTDEYIITAVAEKWHRWTEGFPAAYLVFQYMHRSESDLVGLHLSGYGGNVGNTDPKLPDGIANANYFVFAGFQPWPNKRYVAEWAFLYDIRGGLLAQPLIKWNPGFGMSVDLFYNYTNGKLHGDGTDNLIRAIDFADEVGLRFNYQF